MTVRAIAGSYPVRWEGKLQSNKFSKKVVN